MSLDTSRIRALCFDIDGTLSDTDDLYVKRVLGFLPRFLFRDPAHTARRLVMWAEAPGNGLLGLADRLGLDDEMAAVIDWMYRNRQRQPKPFLLVPGVREMLAQLKGYYPMAVVSARPEKGTLAFLHSFELVPYFDTIVTGLSAPHTKPYPDPVLLAAKQMNVLPGQCVMIGDTTVDIRAGKTAGAQTIGVLCGFGEEGELRQLGADLILENTPQLAGLLLKRPQTQSNDLTP
jgi:HAD superfamily hydrolase (TIGR01509 family)